jgi:hypothetical protein
MRPKLTLILALMLIGCTTDPRKQWAVGRGALTTTETVLTTASRSGALPDKAMVVTEKSILASRAALDAADKELIASHDKPTDLFQYYMGISTAALNQLQKIPQPTTQKVNP